MSTISYYSENGCLAFGQQGILRFHEKMTANGVESQLMSGKEVNEKYPKQLKLPDDYNCFFAKNNGMIIASRALATLQVGFSTSVTALIPHAYHNL